MPAATARSAHPYNDTDVIDVRAPRFNQATVALVSVLALLTGWWWLFGLLAAQLILGLALGRRWCLPCVAYFELVQPRVGEGELEDARPPRFANQVGTVFLTAATLAFAVGLPLFGQVLGGIVAALALLAASTGICVGCTAYRLLARSRGIRPGQAEAFDLAELGVASSRGELVVLFTHPLCGQCRSLATSLDGDARPLVQVDVRERPELARRYHVGVVPTAYAVNAEGRVLRRLA